MEKIKVVGLQKSYTTRKKQTTVALYQCNLDVRPGEFLVLLGESGSGKTSLLKVIGGIESYDFGDIYFDGIDASNLTQLEKNMSYVSQNYVLFPFKTIYQNIMMPLDYLRMPREDKVARVKELADLLDLNLFLTRRPRELSGGQQQRVAIARALVKKPSVCLFDEPLSALDPIYHDEIIETLLDVHRKTSATYIYSTHNQVEAFRLADRIAILHNRKVEQIGTVDEFINHPKTLYITKFLNSVFLFNLKVRYIDGCYVDDYYKIKVPVNLPDEIIDKIKDKEFDIAIKRENIVLGGNDYKFDVKLNTGTTITLSFEDNEFILPNPEMTDYFDTVNVGLNFDSCPIFINGENIR